MKRSPASIYRSSADRGHAPASGFTLMELLVTISILLLLMLIVIPNLSGVRMQANQNSAVSSLRGIYQAEVQYQAKYPTTGFSCSLAALGGPAGKAAPTPDQAELLPNDVAGGRKSGYTFTIQHCTRTVNKDGGTQITAFEVTATPQTMGRTGHLGYCIDQLDTIRMDPSGGTNCTRAMN